MHLFRRCEAGQRLEQELIVAQPETQDQLVGCVTGFSRHTNYNRAVSSQPHNRKPRKLWLAAASTLVIAAVGWSVLSAQFEYGRGHAERPILDFFALYALAWAAYLAGFFLLKRRSGKGPVGIILVAGFAARLVLLPSNLIQENDVYRYVLDGNVILHGGNPYQHSPLVLPELAEPQLKRELKQPDAQQVLSRVGYPHVHTIYPPAAQLAFAAGAWLTGWSWMGQRLVFLAFDVAALLGLLFLLRSLELSPAWILLYAWNPLVLKEVTNSVHLDVMVVFFLAVAIIQLARFERFARSTAMVLAGVCLGLAILSKLYPLLLVPPCFLFLSRRSGRVRTLWNFLLPAGATVAAGYLPFVSIGLESLTRGLSTYVQEWKMNQGAFDLLAYLAPEGRLLMAAILASASVLIPWSRKSDSAALLVEDFQWLLLLWFLLMPAAFPWYALALVGLSCMRPETKLSAFTVALSGIAALYYLSFFYAYHDYPSVWWDMTRTIEHLILWSCLACACWRSQRLKKNLILKGESNMQASLRVFTASLVLLLSLGILAAQKEGSGPDTTKTPVVILTGLDPVSLVDEKREKGQESIPVTHDGYKYLFTSARHKDAFLENPAKFAVQDHGNCPVAKVSMNREVQGDPSIFSVYEGRIYLFANNEARQLFDKNPTKYVKSKAKEGSGPTS